MPTFVMRATSNARKHKTRYLIIGIFGFLLILGIALYFVFAPSQVKVEYIVSQIPNGNSLYLYQSPLNINQAVINLTLFNTLPNSPKIKHIFSYGSFMTFTDRVNVPVNTRFYAQILAIPGVESIHAIIEGDNSILNADPTIVAHSLAQTYCNLDILGLTFDLEPMSGYINFTLPMFKVLSLLLSSTQYGCVNMKFRGGRFLSKFAGSGYVAELFKAMGPNGFFILSGYDLDYETEKIHSPEEYGKALRSQIGNIERIVVNTSLKFTVAIPAAASTTEYSKKVNRISGLVTYNDYKNFDGGNGYVEEAVKVIKTFLPRLENNYIGTTIWTLADTITIKDISFYPSSFFEIEGEAEWLSLNLP